MIEGRLVRLRALSAEDLDAHFRWRNDPEVVHWATGDNPYFGPVSREAMATFHEARLRDNPSSELTFTVEDLADGRAIGMADYRDLDPFAGRATVGITIGERDRWGGGYGTEALSLLVGHLFGACRLHRVELDTWSGNERAMRAFRRVGFVEEGRRRSSVRVGDAWYDSVEFGLLREEWAAGR
ncbi:GNAT family N-acetyltransferase [Streptomyces sp. NPDC060011]|uniref:GNAT family N-acetyltransferase n=2 Tax=Streptomyces TaxID=1883 RepID=UPI002254D367|nr:MULTISPECIES: GNAT family protein [unclassified Streptomyces]MCX5132360.1 GNAT family N-acetyltransferase [Streptomyces sp. NBC_00340]MCX5284171.1 GNAT family N-acetyltransferase [Streptomyces sp. NBC_00198]WSD78936.1 GNAT family N-acetyltransferase [Streptomyces sp. NBC_01558]WSK62529.1 GNAT family N-acetyltransferase [Streptomyces sp. NBC_01281]